MDRSVPGRGGVRLPGLGRARTAATGSEGLLRRDLPLPELAEPDVVRYFTHLSQANFSVDTNFYPLGSCTMKYNPKVNDELASIPGFAGLHPLQGPEATQGALELMHRLQDYLCQITGLAGCSLATLAGAHGELAGVLMTQAYHRSARGGRPEGHPHPRQRTRHQPRLGLDGRLRGGGGAVRPLVGSWTWKRCDAPPRPTWPAS